MTDALVAPSARAQFVVTLPPDPSRIGQELQRAAGSSFTMLTDTKDAFLHLARRAKERLVVMTPYMDASGRDWAAELFASTHAPCRVLIVRGDDQIPQVGAAADRLRNLTTELHNYRFETHDAEGRTRLETFHAKIVLADGVAAYVGSANFLYRSREANLECGFLLEGSAVAPVSVVIDAVIRLCQQA